MSGLLAGKRLLVTGVITDQSIAFSVARIAQEQGATVVLTGFGRLSLVERIAKRLPDAGAGDRARRDQPGAPGGAGRQGPRARRRPRRRAALDRVRAGELCSAAASSTRRGTTWRPRCTSRRTRTSRWPMAALPLMSAGGSIVGLTFDATEAWPVYDWMGVAKAGLESTSTATSRSYLGPQGIRVNLVVGRPAADDGRQVDPRLRRSSRRRGRSARRSAGTSPTRSRPRRPAARCCPTGSRPRPARSSTSTAASTPLARDAHVGRGLPDAVRPTARSRAVRHGVRRVPARLLRWPGGPGRRACRSCAT